jgi:anti-sigma B factor antagonist
MKIAQRVDGDVVLLEVIGKVTIGSGDVALRKAVRDQMAKGVRKIVLDLHAMTMMDSSGLGEIVAAYTAATSEGGDLKLARMSQGIRDIFEITQYITIFDVYDTDEEAVAALRAEGG